MIIFGTKAYIRTLFHLTALCAVCGVATPHRVYRKVLRLSVFFVPLIPVSIKHYTECSRCGRTIKITSDESDRLRPHALR